MITGWVLWKYYAIGWGVIIAASQITDSLKDFLPNARRQRAASELAAALEILFIDAPFEWEAKWSGAATIEDRMAHNRKFAKLRATCKTRKSPTDNTIYTVIGEFKSYMWGPMIRIREFCK